MAKVVAFLGLGNMGSGMSENLVKAGFDVRGFDPVPATRERAAAAGLTVLETAAKAASAAEVICSSVPEVEHAKEAYLGETGALTSAPEGAVCFDLSTLTVEGSQELAGEAQKRGVQFLGCSLIIDPAGQLVLAILAHPHGLSLISVRHLQQTAAPA